MCFPVLRSLLTGHFLSEIFPTTFMRIATTHQHPLSPSSLYFPVAFISPDTCFAYNLFIIYLLPRRTDYFHSCSLVYLQSMEECPTHYRPSNVSINALARGGISHIHRISMSALLGHCMTCEKWLFLFSFTLATSGISELLLLDLLWSLRINKASAR